MLKKWIEKDTSKNDGIQVLNGNGNKKSWNGNCKDMLICMYKMMYQI